MLVAVQSCIMSRRYTLFQFLVLFQYLKSQVKFKTDLQFMDLVLKNVRKGYR